MDMGDEVAATMEIGRPVRFRSRMLQRDDVRVELLHWDEPEASGDRERRPMDRFGLTHLCIRVDDVEDLVEAAVAAGGAVHRQTLSVLEGQGVGGGPVKLLYLTDPDGTRIELHVRHPGPQRAPGSADAAEAQARDRAAARPASSRRRQPRSIRRSRCSRSATRRSSSGRRPSSGPSPSAASGRPSTSVSSRRRTRRSPG